MNVAQASRNSSEAQTRKVDLDNETRSPDGRSKCLEIILKTVPSSRDDPYYRILGSRKGV